jgi:tetratricopeptide (TPR) repeat protein
MLHLKIGAVMSVPKNRTEVLFEKIEGLVQDRNVKESRALMPSYLRACSFSSISAFQMLEWYRRLGLYREAFRLCSRYIRTKKFSYFERDRRRLSFWMAILYNYLGVSSLAHDFANNALPETSRDYHDLADIFASDGEFLKAIEYYRKSIEIEPDPLTRKARLARIGLAESFSAVRLFDAAISLMEREATLTDEPAALGLIYRCLGQFRARRGDYKGALLDLEMSKNSMPPADRTADYAFWLKWWGFSQCKIGNRENGLRAMLEAENLLTNLGIRPVAVFAIRALRHEFYPLSAEEIKQIHNYPGIPKEFFDRFPFLLSIPDDSVQDGNNWIIDLASDEFAKKTSTGWMWKYGIPLELNLLASLRLSHPYGLPRPWCIGLLWPDEPLSLLQLEPRLNQLRLRLKRKHGISIKSDGFKLSINDKDSNAFLVMTRGSTVPRLLREKCNPDAKDVSDFYHVNRTQAYRYLTLWKKKHHAIGILKKVDEVRRTG